MAGTVRTPENLSARLESIHLPERHGAGTMSLRLVNTGRSRLVGFVLAFDSVVQLDPAADASAVLVERTSGHHVLRPPAGLEVQPGAVWETGPLRCGHRPGHTNDGPVGAYLLTADGDTIAIRTAPTGRVGGAHAWLAPVPGWRLSEGDGALAEAWSVAAACEARAMAGRPVLGDPAGRPVRTAIVDTLDDETYEIAAADDDGLFVVGGSVVALQWALLTLARACRDRAVAPIGRWTPRFGWRALHVDLARQFFPAADVETLIALTASRRCNRLHLHLTDDEAWRLPIPGYPTLTDVGAWRGQGQPIPPLLGSGAAPFGGSYPAPAIARWVRLAASLGVELVPEIDLPGHCFAALAALPSLVDPYNTSASRSVQHFVDNVLNPGLPATWELLEAVFAEVAARFGRRWLHLGGDEVAPGSWSGSPTAQRWANDRGVTGDRASIERRFMTDVIDLARRTTGARVGVWQEAAESGALPPGEGFVIGWKSAGDCRRLAATGHDVVVSPAERYYLDMAVDTDWFAPGTHWAGHSSLADIESFDPTAGWSDEERGRLLGVQACLWTEHAPDWTALRRLLLPRFDAIADTCWARQ